MHETEFERGDIFEIRPKLKFFTKKGDVPMWNGRMGVVTQVDGDRVFYNPIVLTPVHEDQDGFWFDVVSPVGKSAVKVGRAHE